MRNNFTNLCHNPRFSLWPWGTSGFTGVASSVSYGKSAARWFVQKTDSGSDSVTVSQGTNANTTKYDKWLRAVPNMTITVSALSANNTFKIRQFQEGLEDLGQNILAMTVVASGPAGESFYFGAGDANYSKIDLLGDDSNGDPILVTKTVFLPFDDSIYDYLRITPFESPSSTGTYRLHYVQCESLMDVSEISEFEIRPDWIEWDLIARYITPIKQGMLSTGASTTSVRVPVTSPPGGWRTTPSLPTEGRSASFSITLNSAGTLFSNPSPTFSIASNPAANNYGCVIALGGFTSTASASQYVIGPSTEPICYLDADYF